MNAWTIYRTAIIIVAVVFLVAACRPPFDVAWLIAALVMFGCASLHRPHPG